MRTHEELLKRVEKYKGAEIFYDWYGYIVWQVSTGDNIEIIFIETKEPRKGYGKMLLKEMVNRITTYHSVFVVRLAANEQAGGFYRHVGFNETRITDLYRGDDAVIHVITIKDLVKYTHA